MQSHEVYKGRRKEKYKGLEYIEDKSEIANPVVT